MIGSLIKTILLISVVVSLVLINLVIFLVFTPEPNTAHYTHVKSGNFTNVTTSGVPTKQKVKTSRKSKSTTSSTNSTASPIKYLTLQDGVIAYEIAGPSHGYPVFQLHGIPGSKNWRHINETELLNALKIKLIRFDRMGIGHSKSKNVARYWDWSPANEILNLFPTTKPIRYTVLDVAERHLLPLIQHVLADSPSKHYSLLAYSMGAPYAVAAEQSKNLPEGLDAVALLSPVGFLSKKPSNWCSTNEQLYTALTEQEKKGELFVRIIWDVISKFGFVTHHDRWPLLLTDCLSDIDNEMLFGNNSQSDQWRNIFNQTMIDLYMQGTQSQIDEAVRVFTKESWGFEPRPTRHTTRIIYTEDDIIAPKESTEELISLICSSDSCSSSSIPQSSHFDIFGKSYGEALKFIQQNSKLTTLQNEEGVMVDDQSVRAENSHSNQVNNRVVVVGGGLAGFSAAIEAVRSNANVNVVIVDKEERFGGNSAKASSGMNAAPTTIQENQGVHDSVDEFYRDVIKSGSGLSDENLVKILVDQSKSAWEFLTEVGKVDMSVLSHCGGHSKMRTHRNHVDVNDQRPKNVGWEVISKLQQLVTTSLEYKDRITLMNKTRVTGFIIEQVNNKNVVKGVYADSNGTPVSLYASSVILASGGYGQDRTGLLAEYAPDWIKELPSTNGAFSTGDLIKIAQRELNVQIIHMDKIQVHPTGFVNPQSPTSKTVFLAAEALRGYGGILVNQHGKRFTNEVGTRDHVTESILKHSYSEDDKMAWSYLILNQNVVDNFGRNLMGFYVGKGFFTKHNSAEEMATHYNVPELLKTLEEYNSYEEEDPYGKNRFATKFDLNQTFYVAKITPSIHYTMGGIKFNEHGNVLDMQNEHVAGLFACGEVTGGLHGNNRLAGNSLLETVVFGRICGRNAASSL